MYALFNRENYILLYTVLLPRNYLACFKLIKCYFCLLIISSNLYTFYIYTSSLGKNIVFSVA